MNIKDRLSQIIQEKEDDPFAEELANKNDNDQIELFEPSPFFGKEQVRNLPACLEFRFATGTSKAFPYSYILEINYDPSEGIEILTSQKKIFITGRNLRLLHSFLLCYQVKFIQENIGNDLTEETKLFVKSINIEDI